ncbi:MAG: dihydroorotate dehydrogenase electron transfer subunit [Dissulfurispiraceae bacterium]
MSKYFNAEIVDNGYVNEHIKLLTLRPLSEVIAPEAGQFYMLQVGNSYDPLLKRPFSIFRYDLNCLQFLYRVIGKGTSCLAARTVGDPISVIGPLGKGYPSPEGDFIAIAGGIGIASLWPMLEKFRGSCYLFYGARTRDELVMSDEAEKLSKHVFFSTDDGSAGQRGFITALFKDFFDAPQGAYHSLPVYACGPVAMIKNLSVIISGESLRCYASLEENMACGLGACLSCVVKTTSGNRRVCKEGPVFDLGEILR